MTHHIRLNNHNLKLCYDNAALYEFEGIEGRSVTEVMVEGSAGIRQINHLIYVGLLRYQPEITLQQVINWVDIKKLSYYMDVVGAAVNDYMDTGEEPEPTGPEKND
jgi:hypothetical protein